MKFTKLYTNKHNFLVRYNLPKQNQKPTQTDFHKINGSSFKRATYQTKQNT